MKPAIQKKEANALPRRLPRDGWTRRRQNAKLKKENSKRGSAEKKEEDAGLKNLRGGVLKRRPAGTEGGE